MYDSKKALSKKGGHILGLRIVCVSTLCGAIWYHRSQKGKKGNDYGSTYPSDRNWTKGGDCVVGTRRAYGEAFGGFGLCAEGDVAVCAEGEKGGDCGLFGEKCRDCPAKGGRRTDFC